MSRAQALAAALLRDRTEHATRRPPRSTRVVPPVDFDVFAVRRWRVIAGGDPGYLPGADANSHVRPSNGIATGIIEEKRQKYLMKSRGIFGPKYVIDPEIGGSTP